MAIQFRCAQCGQEYRVGDDMGGKRGKCRQCGAVMEIPRPAGSLGAAPPASAPIPPGPAGAPWAHPPAWQPPVLPQATPGKRPASVTVIAVLGFIGGGFSLINVPLALAQLAGAWPMAGLTKVIWQDPLWRGWSMIGTGIGAITGGLWIAASVGLLRMRSWARFTAIGLLVFGMFMQIVGAMVTWQVLGRGRVAQRLALGSRSVQMERTVFLMGIVVAAVFGLAYCITLLALLARRKIAQAFQEAERRRMPT